MYVIIVMTLDICKRLNQLMDFYFRESVAILENIERNIALICKEQSV